MGFVMNPAALNVCSGILVDHRQLIEGRDFELGRPDGKMQAAPGLCFEKLASVLIHSVAQLAWLSLRYWLSLFLSQPGAVAEHVPQQLLRGRVFPQMLANQERVQDEVPFPMAMDGHDQS